jgi:hypothetical protein
MSSGFTEAALVGATKLAPRRFKAVRAGSVELTSRQKKAIDQLTGKTCGQLAALELEPHGGPLTELMDSWAEAVPVRQRVSTTKAKKRARV